MKKLLFLPLVLAITLAAHAQQDEVRVAGRPIDTTIIRKLAGDQKVITIRLKGEENANKKYTIEVDGDKIKVNGKDIGELKDVDVSVGRNRVYMNRAGSPGEFHVFTSPEMNIDRYNESKRRVEEVRGQRTEPRAFLGVNMEKTENGVRITDIVENSGAAKAGLKKDDIITSIDGKKIAAELDVTKIIGSHKPGEEIDITYNREGKDKKIKATLGKNENMDIAMWMDDAEGHISILNGQNFEFGEKMKMPEFPDMNKHFEYKLDRVEGFPLELKNGQNGISVVGYPRPRLGVSVKETESGKGLEVTGVDENSVAAKAGIKKGDVITDVAGKSVNSVDEIRKVVAETKSKPFNLQYNRNGSNMSAEIKFPKPLKETDL